MNTQPLASIVICSYNYDRFLGEAIDSALNQTYPHVEVVVVDDGSTDHSRGVIARYGDRIVPILKENEGHDAAVNSGFQVSRGEVVCFLDSDDALFPTAMERAVDALRDPAIVKVHWPLCIVDEDGCRTGKLLPGGNLPHGDLRDEVIARGPQCYPTPPTSGNAWARGFLAQVCPIRPLENRAGTADDQLSMFAPLFGRIAAVDSQGVFRAHGRNSYWGRSLDDLAMTLRDYEQYCDLLSSVCRGKGFAVDPRQWRRESWFHRLRDALQDIVGLVPEGHAFILVDEDKWGCGGAWEGRQPIPFLERDGSYHGRPAGDDEAVEEVERLRRAGASFLVIGWPAFWWREHYPKWHRYMRARFRCAVENDRVVVFDLRQGGGPAMTHAASPLNLLTEYDYNYRLWEPDYWRPYVQDVWARHQLPGGGDIRSGGGTNAVMIVDGRYAVKFFSRFAGTLESFLGERDVHGLAARYPDVLVPALAADGYLLSEPEPWRWPYMVTALVPGTAYRDVRPQLPFEDRSALAEFLGRTLRRLHELPLDGCAHLRPSWDGFTSFLVQQRPVCVDNHAGWGTLPEHLHDRIDHYLPPIDTLFDPSSPAKLLHCDLVGRHVLGQREGERWRPTCLIDFGDAKVGDPLYDLAALHVGLFRCDKRLLRVFLESYGLHAATDDRFVQRCMSYTLLHEFYIERPTFPGLSPETRTLEELATLVWDIAAPGLPGSES